jgi:hypothetical protein
MKWDAPLGLNFGLSLWRLHTMVVQVERPWEFMTNGLDFGLGLWRLRTMPGQWLHLLYFIGYVFSTHFFGLSTKLGHSIPQPLNLDDQSVHVKQPLFPLPVLWICNEAKCLDWLIGADMHMGPNNWRPTTSILTHTKTYLCSWWVDGSCQYKASICEHSQVDWSSNRSPIIIERGTLHVGLPDP